MIQITVPIEIADTIPVAPVLPVAFKINVVTISDKARKDGSDRGVLYAAGMIAGEGIVGIHLFSLYHCRIFSYCQQTNE